MELTDKELARIVVGGAMACIILAWILWWLFRPKSFIHEQRLREAQEPYNTGNVRRRYCYNIWCSRTHQSQVFTVLDIADGYLRVGVLQSCWHLQPQRRQIAFSGWIKEIRHDQFLTQEDLLSAHPEAGRLARERLESIQAN